MRAGILTPSIKQVEWNEVIPVERLFTNETIQPEVNRREKINMTENGVGHIFITKL